MIQIIKKVKIVLMGLLIAINIYKNILVYIFFICIFIYLFILDAFHQGHFASMILYNVHKFWQHFRLLHTLVVLAVLASLSRDLFCFQMLGKEQYCYCKGSCCTEQQICLC